MDFRFVEESDIPLLTDLINKAFSVERFFKAGDRLQLDDTRRHFQLGKFLVAEEDGKLAGCVYVELRGERAYLGLLSVDPDRQKSGLGRRLTSAAEEFAREMGARWMDLRIVNLRLELPVIYEKLGYKVTGTEPFDLTDVPITQPCHFVQMSKELGHR